MFRKKKKKTSKNRRVEPPVDVDEQSKVTETVSRATLEEVKLTHKYRKRRATGLQLGEQGLEVPETPTKPAEEEKPATEFEDEFKQQAKKAVSEVVRDQWIEQEILRRRGGDTKTTEAPAQKSTEDPLDPFAIPEHLKLRGTKESGADEANVRWLTGIAEVPLSIDNTLQNIERTERALEAHAQKKARLKQEKKRRLEATLAKGLPAEFAEADNFGQVYVDAHQARREARERQRQQQKDWAEDSRERPHAGISNVGRHAVSASALSADTERDPAFKKQLAQAWGQVTGKKRGRD